jgi:hypothetical protein
MEHPIVPNSTLQYPGVPLEYPWSTPQYPRVPLEYRYSTPAVRGAIAWPTTDPKHFGRCATRLPREYSELPLEYSDFPTGTQQDPSESGAQP